MLRDTCRKAAGLFLLLLTPAAWAVTSGLATLPVGATDGKTYAAQMAVGLKSGASTSWQTTAAINQSVTITGSLDPASAHVGGKGDIFVVEWVGGKYSMLTANGTWAPWSGRVVDLQPARDDVTLTATQDITIFNGPITVAGSHRIYLGYLPANSSALIYTTTPASFEFTATTALSYFETQVFEDIVLSKCTLCHVDGGTADVSGLHFIRDLSKATANYDIFKAFYSKQVNGYDYVLSKVSGGSGHTGGIQLAVGSTGYQTLATFLNLLDGTKTTTTQTAQSLFDGVKDQSSLATLRDGALLLAGRLPTTAETAAVTAGGDAVLRQTLMGMMQGGHFHEFLKDGANDRLLLRGNEDNNLVDDCPTCFPLLNAEYWRLKDKADDTALTADRAAITTWMNQLNYTLSESPLELIAYVVENNKPYSEILTADYDMLTPALNPFVEGTAVFSTNAGPLEFKPGRIMSYYHRDSATVVQAVTGATLPRITNPGTHKDTYPHVGVLNSKSFLSRFPTTATNRNRARARWTYYNFLGVDIEALAKRTTDPVALADTNNPTMNNPSCTVCHSVLDPVAGTFQDYFDTGVYKAALSGTDSLDNAYKRATPRLYVTGDIWYRDMRVPGFEGSTAPSGNALRWLAEKIVKDERFATGTVQFWWPAVMGAELLHMPETTEDANYQARLAAYEAQQAEIKALASKFTAANLSLKSLLAEMVMSHWYRAEKLDSGVSANGVQSDARELANITDEKLLTPEQLARKTHALTGFNWNAQNDATTQTPLSGLENDYMTFYGGIDGFALKTRARLITPMMSNVAASHALESSCPIVLGDFIRTDAQRLLFGGLSPWMTPLTEANATQTMTSTSVTDFKPFTLTVNLQAGPKKIVLSELNDACDFGSSPTTCRANKNLVISTLNIRRPNGQTVTINGNAGAYGTCASVSGTTLTLNSSCTVEYSVNADVGGSYTVTANVAARQDAADPVLAGMNIESNVAAAASTAAGATAIKTKLVELHSKLLGQTVTVTSPEVLASYDLLVQTWQSRIATKAEPSLLQRTLACDWSTDIGFVSTLGYPNNPFLPTGRYNLTPITTWLTPQAQDPLYMKQSWVVVMAYLLSHYDYLHE